MLWARPAKWGLVCFIIMLKDERKLSELRLVSTRLALPQLLQQKETLSNTGSSIRIYYEYCATQKTRLFKKNVVNNRNTNNV